MGRLPKFTVDELLDVAAELLIAGGPASLTASAVARVSGAPNGSVYHRFASRDELAAALWMRTVERFDADVVAGLVAPGEPIEIAVAAAIASITWSIANPVDAFILTMFRRSDLIGDGDGDGPSIELSERARALGARQRTAVDDLAGRLGLSADLVSFAVAGIPMAAMRRYVGERSPIPAWVPAAVERSVRAALAADLVHGVPR